MPFPLRVFRGAALATLLAVAVCPQLSCLLPQDISPSVVGPIGQVPVFLVQNFPDYLSPPILTLIRQGTADAALSASCHCRLEFDRLEIEATPAVTYIARWFVDYDPSSTTTSLQKAEQRLDAIFNDPNQTTRSIDTFPFDVDDPQLGVVSGGVHVVDLVVAEVGAFNDTSPTQPHRAMNPGFTPATYRFVVDVQLQQVPGQCPRTPPSHPVGCP
jgi:hypothetical protein